jgi:hypothetical protein
MEVIHVQAASNAPFCMKLGRKLVYGTFKEAEDEKVKGKRRGDNLKVHYLNSTTNKFASNGGDERGWFVPGAELTGGKTAGHFGYTCLRLNFVLSL